MAQQPVTSRVSCRICKLDHLLPLVPDMVRQVGPYGNNRSATVAHRWPAGLLHLSPVCTVSGLRIRSCAKGELVRVARLLALAAGVAIVIVQLPAGSVGSNVRDVGKAAGLPRRMHSWDVQPVDIDRDGWTDLIISHHHERATVYRNEHAGGESLGFTPMATLDDTVHHWNDVHGCAAADVNRDRLTDIICLTGAEQGTSKKWNQMWIQSSRVDVHERGRQLERGRHLGARPPPGIPRPQR